MRFLADFHVHSRFSIATSKSLDVEHLFVWAKRKGLSVIGTGDIVHPGWRGEILQSVVPAEDGLYRLKPNIEQQLSSQVGSCCQHDVRFMLTGEISTIYSDAGKIRKVHHLVCLPSFDSAERLAITLSRMGSISSDGRPILGIGSRQLLEMTLETHPFSFLVPAHIWTPWFSALGSRSGYDSIEMCYGDLARELFAIETGLSSDPAMNWRVSSLDRYTIISNSDAHSPRKLGREANVFDCELSFPDIRNTLRGEGQGKLVETIEFFPEEGKYHLDGHRKCGTRLAPEETTLLNGRCPVCGGNVTIGVMNRVMQLADRTPGWRSPTRPGFKRLLPLEEVLGQVLGRGVQSRAVQDSYLHLITTLGPELSILTETDLDDLEYVGGPLLAEAIKNLRAGVVETCAGYDGEYGTIRVLGRLNPAKAHAEARGDTQLALEFSDLDDVAGQRLVDGSQSQVREHESSWVVVIAGPGSGKTHLLTSMMAERLTGQTPEAEKIIGITFTRAAARELAERLPHHATGARKLWTGTVHQLCYDVLSERNSDIHVYDESQLSWLMKGELAARGTTVSLAAARRIVQLISLWRSGISADRAGLPIERDVLMEMFSEAKARAEVLDYDDLIRRACSHLEESAIHSGAHLYVDEFQDLDREQYLLVMSLAKRARSVMAIGDPYQAIYGFRGADPRLLEELASERPHAAVFELTRSYRCGNRILAAADAVVERSPTMTSAHERDGSVRCLHAGSMVREARMVVGIIREIMGGTSFLNVSDADRDSGVKGFSDIAVLSRTSQTMNLFGKALHEAGIPYRAASAVPLSYEPEVSRVLAWLRLAVMPGSLADRIALFKTDSSPFPPRDLTLEEETFARGLLDLSSLEALRSVRTWWRPSEGIRDEWWAALERCAKENPELRGFVRHVGMERDLGVVDPNAEAIRLMTIHAAKGLEFGAVFVVGFREGLIPLKGADLDEERRLCYVAMTRARSNLFLTWGGAPAVRSRFAKSIPLTVLETPVRRQKRTSQLELRFDRSGGS